MLFNRLLIVIAILFVFLIKRDWSYRDAVCCLIQFLVINLGKLAAVIFNFGRASVSGLST